MYLPYRLRLAILIKVLLLSCTTAAPKRETDENVQAMRHYLMKYSPDYVPSVISPQAVSQDGEDAVDDVSLEDNPVFTHSVITFQRMANIDPTGTLTKETMEKLKESRCGVPDHIYDPNAPGRYEVLSTWISKKDRDTGLYTITYSFPKRKTPKDVTFQSFKKGVTLAMCSWELISNVRFKNIGVGKKADVVITYETGDHGDGYSFDGKGGTLGHAFYPEDGRLHLDIEEAWYLASPQKDDRTKKDIYTATLHELGHTLGLLHSKESEAVMAPFYRYRGSFGSFSLPDDEVAGVEQMYGKRIDSNPVNEAFSACREAQQKRFHRNITVPMRLTAEEGKVAILEEKPCEDEPGRETQCPLWKDNDFCVKFATRLHIMCKKTCGFCPSAPPLEKIEEELPGPSGLASSICDMREFDSVVTTYDKDDGFGAFLFKDGYFFNSHVTLLPSKYPTHSLFNKTEDLKGTFGWNTDPKSIHPGLFKIGSSTFMSRTKKVDASLVSGRRYFVFEGDKVHVYKIDMVMLSFEKTYETPLLFPAYPNANVDAAHATVNEEEDSVTYTLFYGSKMWQYKEYRDMGRSNLLFIPLEGNSGIDIAEWHGIPACNVDAVFEYRGIPYFLKGNIFWAALDTEPQIARDITYSFFRCWQTEPENLSIPTSCEARQENPGNGARTVLFQSTFWVSIMTLIQIVLVKHIL